MGYWDMRAALEWQLAMGVDEAILDAPVDRTSIVEKKKEKPALINAPVVREVDVVALAEAAAQSATDLSALSSAIEAYEHCEFKKGARRMVFSDGNAAARVMIVGEAPDREEDREGRPFVGRPGHLLDLMFSHIGLSREADSPADALYLTTALPWRPPQGREPRPDEMAMMLPFLRRHIKLAKPQIIVAMGNQACLALIGKQGVSRLRGEWNDFDGTPLLPMAHPSHLLRTPLAKREAWADLLSIKARLSETNA